MHSLYYYTRPQSVKATYTIRLFGRVWRVRMSHLEVLGFIRQIFESRRNA